MIGLAGLFASSGSVVDALDPWLATVCNQDCTPAALANASSIIDAGCASDLASGASVAVGLEVITTNYTLFHDTLCLRQAPNATAKAQKTDYCVSELLGSVQAATGTTLNSSMLLDLATGGTAQLMALFRSVSADAVCTDCVHALFTELTPLIGEEYAALGGAVLNGMCVGGGNFTDGAIPSGVVEAAAAATATAKATTGQAAVATSGAGVARGVWGVVGILGAAVAGASVLL